MLEALSARPSGELMDAMRGYIGNNPVRYAEMVGCMIDGDENISKYASWLIGHVMEQQPQLIQPHYAALLDNLKKDNLPDTIKRCTMKALVVGGTVPEEMQGTALKYAFAYLSDPKTAVSIQVYAMQLIFDISKNEPDLLRELKEVIELGMPMGSAGYRSRGRRILHGIEALVSGRG